MCHHHVGDMLFQYSIPGVFNTWKIQSQFKTREPMPGSSYRAAYRQSLTRVRHPVRRHVWTAHQQLIDCLRTGGQYRMRYRILPNNHANWIGCQSCQHLPCHAHLPATQYSLRVLNLGFCQLRLVVPNLTAGITRGHQTRDVMTNPSLRVLIAHRPPLAFVDEGNTPQPIFSGYLVDLLPTLLEQAKVQSTYQLYAFQGPGGMLLRNGSWTGVMGELTTDKADMALFPLTLTSQRSQYIQHTQSFMDDGYGILVQTRQTDSGYSFLLPFEPLTWVLLLVALLAVMGIIWALDAMTRRIRLRAIERTHGVFRVQRVRRRDKLMGHAIETIMMAVGSGSTPTTRSCSVKVMFVAWAIFCVIMLSTYTASLTANLTVNQIGTTIKSLSDLAQSPQPFGVPAESSVSAYFSSSSDKGATSLRPKMVEYADSVSAVEALRDGKISAFINDYPTVQFFTQEPPCDLALGTETIGSGALVIGLALNSTLTARLNSALLQLSEAGYLAELRRKWFVQASQCTAKESNANGDGRLSLEQAWSVFLVLGVGAGIAIIVALLEVIYYRRFFSGVQELKQDMVALGPRVALKKRVSSLRSHRSGGLSGSLSGDLENQSSLKISPSVSSTAQQQQQRQPRLPENPSRTVDLKPSTTQVPHGCAANNGLAKGSSRSMRGVRFGKLVGVGSSPSQMDDSAAVYDNTRTRRFEVQQDAAAAAAAAAAAGDEAGSVGSSNELHPSQQQQQQVSRRLTPELLDQAHQQRQQQQPRSPFALCRSADWHDCGAISTQNSLRGSEVDGAWSSDSSTNDARVNDR